MVTADAAFCNDAADAAAACAHGFAGGALGSGGGGILSSAPTAALSNSAATEDSSRGRFVELLLAAKGADVVAGSAVAVGSVSAASGSESLAKMLSATACETFTFFIIASLDSVGRTGTCACLVVPSKTPTKNRWPLRVSRKDRPSGSVVSHKGGFRAGAIKAPLLRGSTRCDANPPKAKAKKSRHSDCLYKKRFRLYNDRI